MAKNIEEFRTYWIICYGLCILSEIYLHNLEYKAVSEAKAPKMCRDRSSFMKRSVLGNFAKFTGKHLSQSLFFNKFTGLRPATLLKRRR